MINIEYKHIKAIIMTLEDFTKLIEEITDNLMTVDYEFGAYLNTTEKAEETNTYWDEDIYETLSNYFNVKVTSFHSDTCEYPMVYICY